MKQLELAFPTVKQRINRLESIMEKAQPSERFGMLEIDEEQNDPKIVAYRPSTQLDFFYLLEEKEAEVISLADYKASKESAVVVQIELVVPENKEESIEHPVRPVSGVVPYFQPAKDLTEFIEITGHPIYKIEENISFIKEIELKSKIENISQITLPKIPPFFPINLK